MKITKRGKRTKLDKEIDDVFECLKTLEKDSEEYSNVVDNLERLYKVKESNQKNCISPDTKAIILGNLMGIFLILGYEKANVITSKALGFIIKGRV